MPSQKFDISIILNVLSQNLEELDKVAADFKDINKIANTLSTTLDKMTAASDGSSKSILKIRDSLKSAGTEIANVFGKFQRSIGGTDAIREITDKLDELRDKASKDINLDVKTDLREIDIYIKRLQEVLRLAEKIDDKELFESASGAVDSAKALKKEFQDFEKISLDKNLTAFKLLLDESNTGIKKNLKSLELLASAGFDSKILAPFITNLEQAKQSLEVLSKEAQSLGVSTRTIDASIENLSKKINEFKNGKPAKIGTIQGLDEIVKQFADFEAKAKARIPIDFIVPKAELDQLQKKLIQIRNEAANAQDFELFKNSTTLLAQLEAARQELKRIEGIQLDRSITPYKFELKQAYGQLKELTAQSKNLIDSGADVATLQALRTKIDTVRNTLIQLRRDAEALGKSTVDINIHIGEAAKTLKTLDAIDDVQVRIKRNEIDLKVKNKLDLDDAISKLKELNRQLNDAVEKRDYKSIEDIKRKANELREIQTQIGPKIRNTGNVQAVNVFSGFTQGLDNAEKRLVGFQKEAGTGLTRIFNNVGANFKNAFRETGGTNAAIKAVAGSFRLLGNSALVVGGDLRTLGFAFNAIGTVVQNFVPLILELVKNLGIISIPLIAIAGYFGLLVSQGLLLLGVLSSVVTIGLKFNDEFSRTANSVAGVVQLFFDITENGQKVGEGLNEIAAAQIRLSKTTIVVKRELRKLALEALDTEFKTQQLFPAFNSVATAASKLVPNIETLTALTGGLARVASVAQVPTSNLGSSIIQLLRGTGRITNRLQAFFNSVKDSKGIELTAKRIRELRRDGTLLAELFNVTNKFSALGEEQAKTLSGSFGNLVEVFEQFAAGATQKAYDTLRVGFFNIQRLVLTEINQILTNAKGAPQKLANGAIATFKSADFIKPILVIQTILNDLFNKVAEDFIELILKIARYIISLADYLQKNGTILDDIYESGKLVLSVFVDIIGAILGFTRQLLGAQSNLEAIKNLVISIGLNFVDVEYLVIGIIKLFKILALGIAGTLQLVNRLTDPLNLLGRRDFFDSEARRIKNDLFDIDAELDLLNQVQKKFIDLRDKKPAAVKVNLEDDPAKALDLIRNLFNGLKDEDDKDKKKRKDRATSTLNEGKQLAEAQIALAKATEEAQIAIVKDRLNRQQALIQGQLEANVVSQSAATARILALKEKELAIEEIAKRNDIERAKTKQALLEKEFNRQAALVIKQNKGEKARESKLEEVSLNRETARINMVAEIKKNEGEILQIKEKQLDLQLEALNAQLSQRKDLIAQNIQLRKNVSDFADPTDASSLAANQKNIIREQAEEVRKLEQAYKDISTRDFANLAFAGGGVGQAFREGKTLLAENIALLKQQLELKIQAARFDFTRNVFQREENYLRLEEDKIQQNLAIGAISEYEAAVQTKAVRLQSVAALEEANRKLKESKQLTKDESLIYEGNLLKIKQLSEDLPDTGILDVTKTIGDSFTNLFEKIQEDIGDTKNAFRDFANSILGSFRRLVAQRLSESLFEKLLTPKGKVGTFLETLGLSRTAKVNEEAVRRTAESANEALARTQESLGEPQKTAQQLLNEVNKEFQDKTNVFTNALQVLANKINNVDLAIPTFSVVNAKKAADEAASFNVLTQINAVSVESLVVNNLMLTELRNITALLSTSASTSGSFDFCSLIPEEKSGGLIGKLQYFAKGGGVKGSDVIPAYLSNGEYIFSPEMVSKIGLPVLEYINKFGKIPAFASGGLFENFGLGRSGPSSFGDLYSFANGAASLRNKPNPIIEKVLEPIKKKGKLKSIFGNILSFAAPFLNFIPGVGRFLSLGAGALGGALTGSNKGALGGILGGIFGGLSNLGGFTGKGGFLGNLAGKVGSPTGQAGLGLFSSILGNSGNTLGQLGAAGIKNGKFAGIFDSLKGLGGSAFLKKILGFFDIFKFGKLFDLGSILGKKNGGKIPSFAGGGQANLGKLLGLFSAITSISKLFGGSGQPEFSEEIIDDPDAARKNKFGSAYSNLIEAGFIPDFQYSAETLKKLQNQFAGIKNLVKNPKQSIFEKLFSILPSLAGLFNFGGSSGKSPSTVGTASTSIKDAIKAAGFAGGGKVVGKGTGTSDSILSLLRPDSFILKAKSVRGLEESLLSSIDSQIFRFADGGNVSSELLKALPELAPTVNGGNQSVSIHNYVDLQSAMRGYLSSPQGTKDVLNLVNRNKNGMNGILRGRR